MLEGTAPWELPECLLGALRLEHLDITKAKTLDLSREVPLKPAASVPKGVLHSRGVSLLGGASSEEWQSRQYQQLQSGGGSAAGLSGSATALNPLRSPLSRGGGGGGGTPKPLK